MASSRCQLALSLALLVSVVSVAVAQQSPPVATLSRAKDCKGNMSKMISGTSAKSGPGQGTITMVNDGNWCWIDLSMHTRGVYVVAGVTVTQPPRNGTVMSGGVDTSPGPRTRLAYKPATGFAGPDTFSV